MAWRCGASRAAGDAARKPWAAAVPVAWANRRRASGSLDDAPHRLRPPFCPADRPRDLYGSLSALLGISGADAICQGLADTAGIGVTRTYRAWLASGDGSPDTLFVRSESPYVRTDGATVADDYTDLTTCDAASPFDCLQNPINVTEKNVELAGFRPVWTNVLPSGSIHGVFAQDSCFYWTADVFGARVGNADHTTAGWTAAGAGLECGSAAHLFCFEQ